MVITRLIAGLFFLAFFVGWIWALRRKLGLERGNTCTLSAQLTNEKVEKNVNKTQWGDWKHKRTTATYSYIVNGIRYDRTCVVYDRVKPMPSSSKLIYQKKYPKVAYLPEFEPANEKGFCLFLFVGMLLFGLVGFATVFF